MLDTGNFNHLASTAKRIGSGEFSLCLNEELMRFSDARSLALRRLGRRHDHRAVKQIRLQDDGASVEDSLARVSMRHADERRIVSKSGKRVNNARGRGL